LQIASVLDCKGFGFDETESTDATVEAAGFCQNSSFPLAATGSVNGLLCIWDTSKGVRFIYNTAAALSSLLPLPPPVLPLLTAIMYYTYFVM
jgi:hypothetical protein